MQDPQCAVADGSGRQVAVASVPRTAPLRVDAQRNLEHVLRAAREVFGELGYGAPMEDVARRARVGVGTVYRRFPSKEVLVRRIAEEETARLTEQARSALGHEEDPWAALARFLRTSAASGAGRLLPPQVLRVGAQEGHASDAGRRGASAAPKAAAAAGTAAAAAVAEAAGTAEAAGGSRSAEGAGVHSLLSVVGELVDRARTAGRLRPDVGVADVLLVIATSAPALPDPAQQSAVSERLLEILLEGLRARPVGSA